MNLFLYFKACFLNILGNLPGKRQFESMNGTLKRSCGHRYRNKYGGNLSISAHVICKILDCMVRNHFELGLLH